MEGAGGDGAGGVGRLRPLRLPSTHIPPGAPAPVQKGKTRERGTGGDPVAPPLFQLTASFLKLARAETAGVTLSNYDPFNENQSGVINLHLSRDGSQGREHVSRTCFLKCSQKMQSNEREANPQEGR